MYFNIYKDKNIDNIIIIDMQVIEVIKVILVESRFLLKFSTVVT